MLKHQIHHFDSDAICKLLSEWIIQLMVAYKDGNSGFS